jgi:hypothetical protein
MARASIAAVPFVMVAKSDAAPGYNSDVAPILYANCTGCHRAEGVAPQLPLTTYEQAKRWAAAIGRDVAARRMPPWPADPSRSLPFSNDARLPARDVATVVAWVQAGSPRGSGTAPALPAAAATWGEPNGRAPDAVVQLPDVNVPAHGEMAYVVQRVKVPLAQDRWITAMQVRPGNAALVHHMGITEIALDNGMSEQDAAAFAQLAQRLGAAPDALATTQPVVVDPSNRDAYDMLGVYTPGTKFEAYPDGSGKLLKAGAGNYINFNIHYSTIGTAAVDRSQLALWFAPGPVAHQLIRSPAAVETLLANGRQLLGDDPGTVAEGAHVAIPPIPAHAANYELVGMTGYAAPVTLYQLQPHAHMRARDFTYAVVYPDGREQVVLSVPRYDFHWQLAYDLATPLELPAGSKLVVTAHYDNSDANPHLRNLGSGDLAKNCGPDKVAYFRRQNQSWHEMFSPIVQYSVDAAVAGQTPSRLVQVVACLGKDGTRDGAPAWSLTRAGDAVATKTQSTSTAEVAANSALPLGSQHYELLGARYFDPRRYANRKVIAKGVTSGDAAHPRLNLTSLQPLGNCQ